MTQSPAVTATATDGPPALGTRAARTLAAEFTRHYAPASALLVGADVASPVLAAAVQALLPGDTLTLVPGERTAPDRLREHIAGLGSAIRSGRRAAVAPPVQAEAVPADELPDSDLPPGLHADIIRELLENPADRLPAEPVTAPPASADPDTPQQRR